MKHNEMGETIKDEENEIIGRGFGSRFTPEKRLHLRIAAEQEWLNEGHEAKFTVLGKNISDGKATILGNKLNRDSTGILKRL